MKFQIRNDPSIKNPTKSVSIILSSRGKENPLASADPQIKTVPFILVKLQKFVQGKWSRQ